MPKLFDRLCGNETTLTTKLEIKSTLGLSTDIYKPCSKIKDFDAVYEEVKKDIRREERGIYSSDPGREFKINEIQIQVSGKLKGKNLNQQFNDVASYQQFLAHHDLLTTPVSKLKDIKRGSLCCQF